MLHQKYLKEKNIMDLKLTYGYILTLPFYLEIQYSCYMFML